MLLNQDGTQASNMKAERTQYRQRSKYDALALKFASSDTQT